MLDLGFGPRAHAGDGLAGRSPLGFVVRHGGEHVGIDHEAVAGQAAAQRLDEPAAGYPYLGNLTAGRVR